MTSFGELLRLLFEREKREALGWPQMASTDGTELEKLTEKTMG